MAVPELAGADLSDNTHMDDRSIVGVQMQAMNPAAKLIA